MTALSFVWVHPYSQNSGCDTIILKQVNLHDFICITQPAGVLNY